MFFFMKESLFIFFSFCNAQLVFSLRFIVSATFLICHTQATITRLECQISANFSIKLPGRKYDDTVISTHDRKSFKECAILCTVTDQCKFFNLNMVTSSCELISTYHDGYLEENLINNSDWMFAATSLSRKWVNCFLLRFRSRQ